MSNYYHGAKASKQATSVSTPVVADSSIHLIVGTAPVHTVGGKVNEPVYASIMRKRWQQWDIVTNGINTIFARKSIHHSSCILMDLLLWLMSLTLQSTLKERKR